MNMEELNESNQVDGCLVTDHETGKTYYATVHLLDSHVYYKHDNEFSLAPKYVYRKGTAYSPVTPQAVAIWLETSRERKQRIRIFYGNSTTGKDWHEEFENIGYIGRSTGNIKKPLLIQTLLSIGGAAILDYCIVRLDIKDSDGKIKTVYQHPRYNMGKIESKKAQVFIDNKFYANCPNIESAIRLASYLRGERWTK